ncbi:MAG: Calx-beta domain-containing protein [Saprospiraceae bacterium]
MKKFKFIIIVCALALYACEKDSPDDTSENVQVSISDVSVDEGNNYKKVAITLTLNKASESQVTANISSGGGTAEADKDYIPFSNQAVVFAIGETSKNFEMTIIGEYLFENDEFFEVTISSVTGQATIAQATGRVDIINEDVDGSLSVPIEFTCDFNALLNLSPNSEVGYDIMNFGQPENVPNSAFTSVAALGDTISWKPWFSQAGDTILYYEVTFDDPMFEPDFYFDDLSEPVSASDDVFTEAKFVVINKDVNDLVIKYTLWFYIGKTTGERVGPYYIDPKIRVPN